MTTQEFKVDLMKRGYECVESLNNKHFVNVILSKQDVDNTVFNHNSPITIDEYLNENVYVEILKAKSTNIEAHIIQRHNQAIEDCEHIHVTIGKNRKCINCMGNFGKVDSVNINLNHN